MKIITITGQDGSGKTTLQKQLLAYVDDHELGKATDMHLPFSEFVQQALQISGGGKPFGDTYTDRLIFAADNHLAAYHMRELAQSHDYLVVQRGWTDSFVHGAVQGYSYEQIARLNHVASLPAAHCSIYLNCESAVAYDRLKDDPAKDKFETPLYLASQYAETQRFYYELHHNPLLMDLFTEPSIYIDTTHLSTDAVAGRVIAFLKAQKLFAATVNQEVLAA